MSLFEGWLKAVFWPLIEETGASISCVFQQKKRQKLDGETLDT